MAMLNNDLQKLGKADVKRLEEIVQLTMGVLIDSIHDKSEDLELITTKYARKNERENALIDFISSYLDGAFNNYIAVPRYVQKSRARQDILIFVGTHWQEIVYQQLIDFVRDCCRKMGLMDCLCGDPDFMNPLIEQFAFRRSHYRHNRVPQGEVWINMLNGTLEIHDGGKIDFREHRADDFFTYVLHYAYDPNADSPMWHTFLARVMPETEMQMLLAEYIGYCFTKNMKLEKMAVLYGTGCNGKSVTMDVIENILGKENVSHVSLSSATTDDEKRTHLEGKLVNISPESSKNIDTATLKQLVSGEPVNVRKLYVGSYVIYDYAKLITSFNQLPPTERTFGYFRRWLLFPFKVTIPEDEQDINLVRKLCDELPGIMNWVLEGLKRLTRTKAFTNSPACNSALADYQKRTNSALMYLTENCEINDYTPTKLKDLYANYVLYCNSEGISTKMLKRNFRENLVTFGAKRKDYNHTEYYNVKILNYE